MIALNIVNFSTQKNKEKNENELTKARNIGINNEANY